MKRFDRTSFSIFYFYSDCFFTVDIASFNYRSIKPFIFSKELENSPLPLPIRAQIEDIVIHINSHEFSDEQVNRLIAICPVTAIISINEPESLLEISEKKCLAGNQNRIYRVGF